MFYHSTKKSTSLAQNINKFEYEFEIMFMILLNIACDDENVIGAGIWLAGND